jgi:hypothetical protein
MYPDYFVSETPEAVRRRRIKMMMDTIGQLKDVSFEWGSRSAPTIDYRKQRRPSAPVEKTREPQKKAQPERVHSKFAKMAIGLVITALLATGGWLYYQHIKALRQYAFNYVRTICLIKAGADKSIKTSSRIANDWRTKAQSGQNAPPPISAAEETSLIKVKAEADVYMQKVYEPPKPFAAAKESISKLHAAYLNLHNLAISPSGTLSGFTDSASRAEAEFRRSAKELKAGLPPEISEELNRGIQKYKILNDF